MLKWEWLGQRGWGTWGEIPGTSPHLAPSPGRRAQGSQPYFLCQPGCGRVRPPSLTGLLCGCSDWGDRGAAAERRAREAAPRESRAGGAGAAAGGYRIYLGQCRTLGGGSLRAHYRICWELRRPFPGVGSAAT